MLDAQRPIGTRRFKLGVLFIHGIGTQPACDTLVQWGDQLLEVIERATRKHVTTRVERAEPGDSSAGQPTEAIVRIHSDKEANDGAESVEEEWLLAEAWWADAFPAPTYRELVSWSVRAVPWALAIHVARRFWQFPEESSDPDSAASDRRRRFLARGGAVLQLLFALTLVPLVIALLVLTLVLGLLPIPQLRSVILSAQSVLTGTMGDSLAFVESPVRAALIRTRILRSLERLIGQCDRTVVVAHSQGAAAALDALGGIVASDTQGEHAPPVPDTLLTFGAGINQLVSLKVLSRGLPSKLPGNPAYLGVGSLLGTFAMFAWLFRGLRTGHTSISDVLHASAAFASVLAIMSLVLAAVTRWGKKGKTPGQDSLGGKREGLIVTVATLAVLGTMYYSSRNDLPLGTVSLIVLALLMLVASLALILSADMKRIVTAPVREPAGLDRWVDLYASADPVPNGPTKPRGDLGSIPIWNRGSMFSDHTAYWHNLDGFALRVARVCAETAGSPWVHALPSETADVDARAAWRLSFLRRSTWISRLAWLTVLVLLWRQHGLAVPLPVEVPDWIPFEGSVFTQWMAVPTLIVACAWLASRLLFLVWAIWTRAEQRATLAHTPPTDRAGTPAFIMGIIVSLGMVLPYALSRASWFTVLDAVINPGDLQDAAAAALGWGMLFGLIAHWRMPPPKASVAQGE